MLSRKNTLVILLMVVSLYILDIAVYAPGSNLRATPSVLKYPDDLTSSMVTLEVDAKSNTHPISQYIYGMSFLNDINFAKEINLPVDRFGGNAVTRYNWKNDASNRASDWFFENLPEDNPNPENLPDGSISDLFIEKDKLMGARTMLTIPLIGWTPKDRERRCGFSVKKYGPQQQTDQLMPDCGNGKKTDGTTLITGNDPTDTSVKINSTFTKEWLQHLTKKYGTADQGGVLFYEMDNEYDLWHRTHHDIHPEPATTDEIVKLTEEYALAVKEVDPSALTLGPVGWGYLSFLRSALDSASGTNKDRSSHDNLDFGPYYLKAMKQLESKHSKRLLDYLDFHMYPQPANVFSDNTETEVLAVRLRSTQGLWNPDYIDESWVRNLGEPNNRVQLIPRMKKAIQTYYPGTKIAITEYNWGGLKVMNGALAQADILGILGRESVDVAILWGPENSTEPWAYAFRMYRNYDGKGSQFGSTSVSAKSSDEQKLAIYASIRSSDKKLTVIAINKDPINEIDTKIEIKNFPSSGNTKIYTYSQYNLTKIVESIGIVVNNAIEHKFPPYSITLFEVARK
ncbi:uncharacterized protein LOC108740376 isoform X2 [Agrilus planipennis]|uniref:Uncharacterized protein LOC108740376 isoform X2 n=1 Tax=Agrilus planipennis TaxID=224129 RepID=A0A7F5R8F0_AGRPL|nr:uncharacterized protein LOC108740376 isoform X2 [Agrilus planipennis]